MAADKRRYEETVLRSSASYYSDNEQLHICDEMSTGMHTRPSILYIEDNADNQRLVRRILESRGYTVTLANDGPHGIALARESRPAMILVDINIPGLDGYETTTLLRNMEHLRGVPVVAVTADSRVGRVIPIAASPIDHRSAADIGL